MLEKKEKGKKRLLALVTSIFSLLISLSFGITIKITTRNKDKEEKT